VLEALIAFRTLVFIDGHMSNTSSGAQVSAIDASIHNEAAPDSVTTIYSLA